MSAGTISFDLDGTLIHGPFGAVLRELDAELAEQGVPGIRDRILEEHERRLQSPDIGSAYDWDAIARWAAGAALPFDLVDRLGDRVRTGTRMLHADTPDLLDRLRGEGWRVVVLTNGWRRYQEPILAGCGLLAVVDEVLAGDDLGVPKPDPRVFEAARGGRDPYLHVGDRLDHDIAGAAATGARTVLMRADVPVAGRPDPGDRLVGEYLAGLPSQPLPGQAGSAVPDLMVASLADLVAELEHSPTG